MNKVKLAGLLAMHFNDRINDTDYSEVDCFCEDHEVEFDEVLEAIKLLDVGVKDQTGKQPTQAEFEKAKDFIEYLNYNIQGD